MEDFVLTTENYYSPEADARYMSFHNFMAFNSYMGIQACESKALAILDGEWEEPTTDAMLIGSYVDSYFEGTLDTFRNEHPELFKKDGSLYAKYEVAERCIKRIEEDDFFMQMLGFEVKRDEDGKITRLNVIGEHQKIMTGYWAGCEWKIKMDSYIPDVAIVDLKTSANIHKSWNVEDFGRVSFVEYWFYTGQLALYQKIVEINTGKKLPCFIAVVTKEEYPEIEIVGIDQLTLDHALNFIETNIVTTLMVKNREVEPVPCGKCDYCKSKKKLFEAISMRDLIEEGGDFY